MTAATGLSSSQGALGQALVPLTVTLEGTSLNPGGTARSLDLAYLPNSFVAHFDEYAALCLDSRKKAVNGSPTLTGPALIIDVEYKRESVLDRSSGEYPNCRFVEQAEAEIDDLYLELREELRATDPENVGTVVIVYTGSRPLARYRRSFWDRSGPLAHTSCCSVNIIDKRITEAVGREEVTGDSTPLPIREGKVPFVHSGCSNAEILNYLFELPRQ